jgi:thioredoxin 1
MFNGSNESFHKSLKENDTFVLYLNNENIDDLQDLIKIFNDYSKKHQDYKFTIINLDKNTMDDIKVIPTVRLYKEGEINDQYSGKSPNRLDFFISKNFVQHVNTHQEFKKIIENYNSLIAVDFTASWCGPCKKISPVFNELNNKYNNVMFIKVDVDDNEETSEACNIRAMPTFQFYKDNQKIHEFSGADKSQLETSITKYI